ncbi:MAG: sugar phosphate isomerase/epimerase [Pseudomonadota bacterium]
MKLALCNEVIRELTFERQCAFAAAVGFDGLELAPFTLAQDPTTLGTREAGQIRSALAAEGLACCSLHWLLAAPDGLSITTDDPAVRSRTQSLMQRLVGFAAEVGAGVLVHGSPQQRQLPENGAAAAAERALDFFAEAGRAAADAGVLYCIEPLARAEASFINTPAQAVQVVERVSSPGLTAMIDTCATASEDIDVAEALDIYLPQNVIAHVHVNDPNRRGPGEGALRFQPIFAALSRHSYGGWVSAEPFIYKPDGPACAARAAGFMRALTESAV